MIILHVDGRGLAFRRCNDRTTTNDTNTNTINTSNDILLFIVIIIILTIISITVMWDIGASLLNPHPHCRWKGKRGHQTCDRTFREFSQPPLFVYHHSSLLGCSLSFAQPLAKLLFLQGGLRFDRFNFRTVGISVSIPLRCFHRLDRAYGCKSLFGVSRAVRTLFVSICSWTVFRSLLDFGENPARFFKISGPRPVGRLNSGRFSYFRFARFQIEGLKSQNQCLCSLQIALWNFQGLEETHRHDLLSTDRMAFCGSCLLTWFAIFSPEFRSFLGVVSTRNHFMRSRVTFSILKSRGVLSMLNPGLQFWIISCGYMCVYVFA